MRRYPELNMVFLRKFSHGTFVKNSVNSNENSIIELMGVAGTSLLTANASTDGAVTII